MQLTVLGSAASYPDAGRACAGHLLRTDEASVLLDCGNGTLSNLGRVMDPTALDAVFISHGHIDHFADLFALQAALRYAPDGPAAPLRLWLPPGLFARMQAVLDDHSAAELADAFEVSELCPGHVATIGDITVLAGRVDHVGDAYGLMARTGDVRLAYTSDTRLGEAVRALASGATTVLSEATLPAEYAGRAPHMTPGEAGSLAAEAGARTLILTHLWPSVDRRRAVAEARQRFGGRVIVAEELLQLDLD